MSTSSRSTNSGRSSYSVAARGALSTGLLRAVNYARQNPATIPPFRLPPPAVNRTAGNKTVRRAPRSGMNSTVLKARRTKYVKRKRTFRSVAENRGYSIKYETGGTITDPYCVYIGHGTCPQVHMRRLFFGSLLKLMLMKLNLTPADCEQPMTFLSLGDIIRIQFQRTQLGLLDDFSYTLAAAQPTFTTVLNGLITAYEAKVNSIVTTGGLYEVNQWKFKECRYEPDGSGDLTSVRINLENAVLHYQAVSSFKMQNRSVPSAEDDQTDEVDRIPLTGKVYNGIGSGSGYKRTAITAISESSFEPVIERTNGVIAISANDTGKPLSIRDPVEPHNLMRVKRHAKVYMSPGSIKTSILIDKRSMHISSLFRNLIGISEADTVKNLSTVGKFCFYGLEKQLETVVGSTPTVLVQVAYEHDLQIFGYLEAKNTNSTIGEVFHGTEPT